MIERVSTNYRILAVRFVHIRIETSYLSDSDSSQLIMDGKKRLYSNFIDECSKVFFFSGLIPLI